MHQSNESNESNADDTQTSERFPDLQNPYEATFSEPQPTPIGLESIHLTILLVFIDFLCLESCFGMESIRIYSKNTRHLGLKVAAQTPVTARNS